ncbi:hypothetical protein QR680_018561 [Steinernema hermaphroditum]|uniref:Serpentine receptor class gamma n=1 Tax=Steinernema hermaphroditum TaxID=289476 RepID=A0AA39LR12_9BILA|nr:hypothetical protein QR680_018561 [Steinernema hermaphroditum]
MMELYFNRHPQWLRYYNCSFLSHEQWSERGQVSIPMGVYSLVSGVLYLAMYIPCLIVVVKTDQLRSLSCYKIMSCLGIVECLGVVISCLFTGYLFLVGAVFCSSPHVIYIAGHGDLAFWEAQCMLCVLLGVNRVVDFWNIPVLTALFEGYRTFLWFIPILCCCAYFVLFTSPPVFSSIKQQWFFDPYAGMKDVQRNSSAYTNRTNVYANYVTMFLLFIIYGTLIFSLYCKSRGSQSSVVTHVQRMVIIQAVVICLLLALGGVLFIGLQITNAPPIVVSASLIGYQISCGAGGIVYLIVNSTIRREVFRMLHIVRHIRRTDVVQRRIASNYTKSTH